MEILKRIKVPTGDILIVNGKHGKLELLSLSDYGQCKNIKADFLGLKNEINGVSHGNVLPLEDKWVITVSSQYGCSIGCKFCDVPKVGPGINVDTDDIINQVLTGISLHPEINYTNRLNVHYARMGEPTFNNNVLHATCDLYDILTPRNFKFHPVVSSMMPKNNKNLFNFINKWVYIKNDYLNGEAGLQLSINSTDDQIRKYMMNNNTLSLKEISENMKHVEHPVGRKYTLNFALTDAPIDGELLASLFDPNNFMCKITPIHMTNACVSNNIITPDGYNSYDSYKPVEDNLKNAGFDVLVFIPSLEEDWSRITCGNAILSDDDYKIIEE